MKEDQIQWQIAAAKDLDQQDAPHLRMSSGSKCPRSLAYAMIGTEETDLPDEEAENRMALGHMAEILIIRAMNRRGWETKHTVLTPGSQLDLSIPVPGTEREITGHPDGLCRHPQLTKDKWVTLECKSMSPFRGQETEREGIAETYPGYIIQIALYARKLYEMNLTSFPTRGVFAMMDREGKILPPERVTWDSSVYDDTMSKLERAVGQTDTEGVLPERPYAPQSTSCKFCNYHTVCWGEPKSREEAQVWPPKRKVLQDLKIVEAAQTWAKLKPEVDAARDVLQIACNEESKTDIEASGIVAGYFYPRDNGPFYDGRKLQELVPADILRKCLSSEQPEPKPGFWVRPARR